MEKPVTPDGFASRKMLELNEEAKKINLKVGVGLMCRHSQARRELKSKIENGDLGEILSMRAYRMQVQLHPVLLEENLQTSKS